MQRHDLTRVSGQGKGHVLVTLTAEDKPALAAQIEVKVKKMLPNSTFTVARRLGLPPLDGNCASTDWQPLGSITTSEGGSGAHHFEVHRKGQFISDFEFDIKFRVEGNGTELQTDCFRLKVK